MKREDTLTFDRTLSALESALSFDDNVLYAIIHEAIYCENEASNWAADRVGKTLREFQWLSQSPQSPSSVREAPLYFSGEMIYPFLFDIFPELERMAPVADIIASYPGWGQLYDTWQVCEYRFYFRHMCFVGLTNLVVGSQRSSAVLSDIR